MADGKETKICGRKRRLHNIMMMMMMQCVPRLDRSHCINDDTEEITERRTSAS